MKYPYIDMHCDSLLRTIKNGADSLYDGEGMQSIQQMQQAGQKAQFFAIFFPPRQRENVANGNSFVLPPDEEFYETMKQNLFTQVEKHQNIIALAKSAEELEANSKNGLLSAVLSIEDGRMVNDNMDQLVRFKKDGVCAIALTWNYANCFGYPNSREAELMSKGLTDFGKDAISVMNDLGIMIDVSHLSDGGFWDVASLSKKPFVATHSNCRMLSPHSRNLTDEMIKKMAEKGGVAGLNFGPEFLSQDLTNQYTKVEYLVEHVWHMLQVGGEDFPALGTDFDGIGGIFEVGHPTDMDLLYHGLERKGMTARQLEKFAYKNVLRVFHECC